MRFLWQIGNTHTHKFDGIKRASDAYFKQYQTIMKESVSILNFLKRHVEQLSNEKVIEGNVTVVFHKFMFRRRQNRFRSDIVNT